MRQCVYRFPKVAGAKFLWCFDVEARIDTRSSSLRTNCVPHLIFKFSDFKYAYASERIRIEFGVYIDGIDNEERRKHVSRSFKKYDSTISKKGEMGRWRLRWVSSLMKTKMMACWCVAQLILIRHYNKYWIVVQGIELRPKTGCWAWVLVQEWSLFTYFSQPDHRQQWCY